MVNGIAQKFRELGFIVGTIIACLTLYKILDISLELIIVICMFIFFIVGWFRFCQKIDQLRGEIIYEADQISTKIKEVEQSVEQIEKTVGQNTIDLIIKDFNEIYNKYNKFKTIQDPVHQKEIFNTEKKLKSYGINGATQIRFTELKNKMVAKKLQ